MKLFDLRGKTALVTGGTGHLGSAMSEALAEAGAQVIITSRDAANCVDHPGVTMDLMEESSIREGYDAALERSSAGRIDILVNNAHDATAEDLTNATAEGFSDQLKNATAYFLLARMVRDNLVEQGMPGSIVNIGSMYGMVGSYPEAYEDVCPASPVAYHTLKGGILQMTRHLAVYWARDGVRVNALSPGPFPKDSAPAEMVARLETKVPMGRMGRPGELKGALLLLAGDAGSYITGQNIVVDGGWTAW